MRIKIKLALAGVMATALLSGCGNAFPEYNGELNALIMLSGLDFGSNSLSNQNDSTILYVHPGLGSDSYSGLSVGRPLRTIHKALELAQDNYEIHVAQSTYSFNSSSNPLSLKAGVTLLGGYKSEDWNTRDPGAYPTILNDTHAGTSTSDITVAVQANDLGTTAVLDGFTLTGGRGFLTSIKIDNSRVTLRNLNITPGTSSDEASLGIGVTGTSSLVRAENIQITMNDANQGQGGISVSKGDFTLLNSVITMGTSGGVIGNTGIIATNTSGLILRGNRISGLGAKGGNSLGLGLYNLTGTSIVANNMIHGGNSDVQTTGVHIENCAPVLRNNTIYGGDFNPNALVLYNHGDGTVKATLENNIFWNPTGSGVVILESITPTNDASPGLFRNNNVFGGAILYHDANSSTNIMNDIELNKEALTTGGSSGTSSLGNINWDILGGGGFVNFSGIDWRLTNAADCRVREGGRDGTGSSPAWSFSDDLSGAARTAVTTCGPGNTDAGGWSMGAFEF